MDILNIQSLIKEGKIVSQSDVNTEETYIQVGVFQPGNRKSGPSNPNAYASYAIPLSQVSPIGIYGNSLKSLTAGPISNIASIAFGVEAGFSTEGADASIMMGYQSGYNSTFANNSVILGSLAGFNSPYAMYSVFLGGGAGYNASNSSSSNFIGKNAGANAMFAWTSNFIGDFAGCNATSARYSNFIGDHAGFGATNANTCNFIGKETGEYSTGNNVNAFGYRAHKGGSLSGQTVFSNNTLPSYADRTAATTAITIPNGAVAGSTYLYYNQSTFTIEAVRL